LKKLSPAYKVFFEEGRSTLIPDNVEEIVEVFEKKEKGAGKKLQNFLESAAYNYEVAIKDLVYKPGISPIELVTPKTITKVGQFLSTISAQVRADFKDPDLRQILEFPVLFLGAKPSNTPAFYNFMNYADFALGTWFPKGGMYSVTEAMVTLAKSLGVKFHMNSGVSKIEVENAKVTGLMINGNLVKSDFVLSGADYHHTEQLLDNQYRGYSESYWKSRTFAPSSLLFFLGIDKKLKNVEHHNLFFDQDFEEHAKSIYDTPEWPSAPLFYANITSLTEEGLAPEGKETAFLLIPLAPGLEDTPELREKYFEMIMDRFENLTKQEVRKHVVLKKSYCVNDFKSDYNSYGGNAYGLANTLLQTAFLRPKIKSKRVKGLYFTGQLTVPGPGVPPSLISGKIASTLIIKELKKVKKNEVIV
jgi:phytoene desaturase